MAEAPQVLLSCVLIWWRGRAAAEDLPWGPLHTS